MRIRRRHRMTKRQARAWVDDKGAEMLAQFGDSVSNAAHRWNGDTLEFGFTAGGLMAFKGKLRVTESELVLDMPFPLLARGFEGRARAELNRLLDENLPVVE